MPDNTIDICLVALVIHYLDDRLPVLRELHRVLRPGGTLVVSTSHPIADWLAAGCSYFDTGHVEQRWSCGIVPPPGPNHRSMPSTRSGSTRPR
ncbi:class I SAM-dependent methyltransferase [Nocardia rhamnosiphila]|uniref:class I SAM-dependent methyltransferase n=1 Tax=Nocardia rhamnosiphila TaxID=426716 RepID=UPI0034037646